MSGHIIKTLFLVNFVTLSNNVICLNLEGGEGGTMLGVNGLAHLHSDQYDYHQFWIAGWSFSLGLSFGDTVLWHFLKFVVRCFFFQNFFIG